MKRLVTFAASLFASAFLVSPAQADPIGPDCDTCNGGIYTLFTDFSDLNADPNLTTYRVALFMDTSGVPAELGAGVGIDAVSIKIANGTTTATLVSFPSNSSGWGAVEIDSGINNDGCSGSGNGFICTETLTDPAEVGGDLQWVFDVTFTGSLNSESEIKARFVNATGRVGDLLSESIELQESPCVPGTPGCEPPFEQVPEPATLLLIALGLVGAGIARRRTKVA